MAGISLEEFMEQVHAQKEERNHLINEFLQGRYDSQIEHKGFGFLHETFPQYSRIVTHDGGIVPGRDCENYWRSLREMGVTSLDFQEIFFEGYSLTLSDEPQPEEMDYIVYEFTGFAFSAGGKEYRGFIDPISRHRVRCTTEP